MSNPPIDTKKICRLWPSVARLATIRATVRSWFASPVLRLPNAVWIALGNVPLMIGLILTLALSAPPMLACAACTMSFESAAMIASARASDRAACSAFGAPVGSPVKPKLPAVGNARPRTEVPFRKTCEPENDIPIGVAVGAFRPITRCASRPPHPVGPVMKLACACDVCPWFC